LQEAPAVLVLQLKRFEFSARSRTKLGKVSLDQPVVLFTMQSLLQHELCS
jgi:hypothetical protein